MGVRVQAPRVAASVSSPPSSRSASASQLTACSSLQREWPTVASAPWPRPSPCATSSLEASPSAGAPARRVQQHYRTGKAASASSSAAAGSGLSSKEHTAVGRCRVAAASQHRASIRRQRVPCSQLRHTAAGQQASYTRGSSNAVPARGSSGTAGPRPQGHHLRPKPQQLQGEHSTDFNVLSCAMLACSQGVLWCAPLRDGGWRQGLRGHCVWQAPRPACQVNEVQGRLHGLIRRRSACVH